MIATEAKDVLVQTLGVKPVLVNFALIGPDRYKAQVQGQPEYLVIRKPTTSRVQWEDGDWGSISPDMWVCEMEALDPQLGTVHNHGVTAAASSAAQAFEQGFNQFY